MAETSGEVADMLDGLRDAVIIQSRPELGRMAQRLRVLATANWEGEVGKCDRCGSRLVLRGRNPSVLTCPLECEEHNGGV